LPVKSASPKPAWVTDMAPDKVKLWGFASEYWTKMSITCLFELPLVTFGEDAVSTGALLSYT